MPEQRLSDADPPSSKSYGRPAVPHRWRRLAYGLGLLLLTLLALRLLPKPPLGEHIPRSTAVYASGGELLRLTLASDEQFRHWQPLEKISPRLIEAVLLYEDRWFRWHPGINPASLLRSGFATYGGERRQGGSTLSMQLARRLYAIDSRNLAGKLAQIGHALWLEARYSKDEIIEAYLNLAPYGGNVEGVGAASLIHFHKRPAELTLPEALALAVIPQNPGRRSTPRQPERAEAELQLARDRLWQSWLARHPEDRRFAADMDLPLKLRAASELPFRAPHFAEALLREARNSAGQTEIWSSLDWTRQATLERLLHQYVERQRGLGIRNAAALLIDTQDMQVKALVGSADFHDKNIDGQVNGVFAKRSPGSTLKPFIYALALDQGVLHPATMLKDAPTAFGPFSPENFDGRFVGPISAQEALIRSRNVPAVAVAARLARPGLYDLLKSSGVANLAPEKHYGLALTLGGGEVTMEELARLYTVLANQGVLQPIGWQRGSKPPDAGLRLLSEEAAFITLDMLQHNPRPDTERPALPAVAWKTGTSWSFRDAWSAGVLGRHVLVVWVGNFDGSSNAAFVGVRAAAPLFFSIIDGLRAQGLDGNEPARQAPATLSRVEVCTASGDLPNAECRERSRTWFIPGKSPIRESRLHRAVFIDTRSGLAVCSEGPHTRREVYEYWPSDMLRLFRDAGIPRREPPRAPDCGPQDSSERSDAPKIVSPLRGVAYTLRLAQPASIALRAHSTGSAGKIFWFADQALIGQTRSGEALAWNPPAAGNYTLRAVDEQGASDTRELKVELQP